MGDLKLPLVAGSRPSPTFRIGHLNDCLRWEQTFKINIPENWATNGWNASRSSR